jgi:hypothetical protein
VLGEGDSLLSALGIDREPQDEDAVIALPMDIEQNLLPT